MCISCVVSETIFYAHTCTPTTPLAATLAVTTTIQTPFFFWGRRQKSRERASPRPLERRRRSSSSSSHSSEPTLEMLLQLYMIILMTLLLSSLSLLSLSFTIILSSLTFSFSCYPPPSLAPLWSRSLLCLSSPLGKGERARATGLCLPCWSFAFHK